MEVGGTLHGKEVVRKGGGGSSYGKVHRRLQSCVGTRARLGHTLHLMCNCGKRHYTVRYTYATSVHTSAFENTMRKRTTYTTLSLTLELRTSTSTVAITHVCQLLYQEFDAHAAYTCTYILPEARRGNHRDNEQSERAN